MLKSSVSFVRPHLLKFALIVTVIYKTFLAMVSFGIDRKSQKCVEFISGCNISFLGSVTNQG